MAKTALQLLNEVGKNLRRSNGTTYTSLTHDQNAVSIMQFINEAKRMVEEAWKWDALRAAITFTSSAGVHTYDTSDLAVVTSDPLVTTDRAHVLRDNEGLLQFWDVTDANAFRMTEVSAEYANDRTELDTTNLAKPNQVALYQNGNGITAHFPYAPAGARDYKFQAIVPQEDLDAASTTLLVPWRPVVLAATALALGDQGTDERREERYWRQYDDALGKSIGVNSDEFDFLLVPV